MEEKNNEAPKDNDGKGLLKQVGFFFILAVIFLIIISFLGSNEKYPTITINKAMGKAKNGEVESIFLEENRLKIVTKKQEIYISEKEKGETLNQVFQAYKIDPVALEIDIHTINKDSTSLHFWVDKSISIAWMLIFILPVIFVYIAHKRGKLKMPDIKNLLPPFGKEIKRFAPKKEEKKKTFKDIGGLQEVKEELKEIIDFLKEPERFRQMGARIPRGILLDGESGTGKTLLAKALAGEADVPFFLIAGSEFVEKFVGVGAARVRDLFDTAKKNAPCIVFVDELDAVGRHRAGAGSPAPHEEREQTLNQILVEMDGFEERTDIIVIAATNRLDVLDKALLRSGRFDRRITVPLPDIQEREEILKIHCQGKPISKDVNLRHIARLTARLSGADLENIANEAALLAARRWKKTIGESELKEAIEKAMLGLQRKNRVMGDADKKRTAFHELGHFTVARKKSTNPVQKISIIPRGRAGGYTWHDMFEERMYITLEEIKAALAIRLGGRAAEYIFLNEISSGAEHDLKSATELARAAIERWGMSKEIGPVFFGDNPDQQFIGAKPYSEETARLIDKNTRELIEEAEKTAKEIINEEKETVERIEQVLLEKEVLESEELEAFFTENQ